MKRCVSERGSRASAPPQGASLTRDLERLPSVAELFKALGDDTRSRIVYSLSREELSVCNLASVLGMTPQAISYHLRLLRALRLVKHRRDGKKILYSLDDEHVLAILEQALAHVGHT